MDDSNDLTVQEYVAMSPNADVDAVNDVWTTERRKEFREVIDLNKDGTVTVKELEVRQHNHIFSKTPGFM